MTRRRLPLPQLVHLSDTSEGLEVILRLNRNPQKNVRGMIVINDTTSSKTLIALIDDQWVTIDESEVFSVRPLVSAYNH